MNESLGRRPPAVFIEADHAVEADRCAPLEAAADAHELTLRAMSRRAYPGIRLPVDRLQELCTVGYWDARMSQSWGLDWHFNEGIELCLLDAGTMPFRVDEAAYSLQAGDMTITRPWQRHCLGDPCIPPSRLIWVILDVGVRHPHSPWQWPDWVLLEAEELDGLTELLRGNETPVFRAGERLRAIFQELVALLDEGDVLPITRFKLLINNMLLALHAVLTGRNEPIDRSLMSADRTVKMVLDAVCEYPDREWTLDGMARQAGLGRNRFGTTCRQLTNRTPVDFLAQCRIERARELLRGDATITVAEVATASGFHSAQYFCNQFKRRVGCSPAAWRAQNPAAHDDGHGDR